MYAIFRGNKRYGTKRFSSYELARSYARKLIRQGKFNQVDFYKWDIGHTFYSNPALSIYDVSIKAV